MANNTRPTSNKRSREKAQRERQKEKQQRRLESKEAKERKGNSLSSDTGGEDPDIAGIRPGPQSKPDWLLELDAEKEASDEAGVVS